MEQNDGITRRVTRVQATYELPPLVTEAEFVQMVTAPFGCGLPDGFIERVGNVDRYVIAGEPFVIDLVDAVYRQWRAARVAREGKRLSERKEH
jgi:hypothetical protein